MASLELQANALMRKVDKKKKEGDLIISRKVAPHIAKWNNKQQELRAPEARPSATPSSAGKKKKKTDAAPPAKTATAPVEPKADEFDYGDTASFICLLCQRQFKGVDELRRHNSLSNLHKASPFSSLHARRS